MAVRTDLALGPTQTQWSRSRYRNRDYTERLMDLFSPRHAASVTGRGQAID